MASCTPTMTNLLKFVMMNPRPDPVKQLQGPPARELTTTDTCIHIDVYNRLQYEDLTIETKLLVDGNLEEVLSRFYLKPGHSHRLERPQCLDDPAAVSLPYMLYRSDLSFLLYDLYAASVFSVPNPLLSSSVWVIDEVGLHVLSGSRSRFFLLQTWNSVRQR